MGKKFKEMESWNNAHSNVSELLKSKSTLTLWVVPIPDGDEGGFLYEVHEQVPQKQDIPIGTVAREYTLNRFDQVVKTGKKVVG